MSLLGCTPGHELRKKLLIYIRCHTVLLLTLIATLLPAPTQAQNLLTLDLSIQAARQFNLGVVVEEQVVRAKAINIQKAQANTRPTIDFTSDYEHLFGVTTLKNSADLSWDMSALATNTVHSQELLFQSAQQKKVNFEVKLVYQVKVAYYKLMQLRQEQNILQKNHQLLLQQKREAEQLVRAQLRLPSALNRIGDSLHTLENQILQKQGEVSIARSNLLQLTNVPNPQDVHFAACTQKFPPAPIWPAQVSQSIKKTPELQQMILEQKSLDMAIDEPWKKRLPTISLSAEYQQEWPQGNEGPGIHLVLTFPLFDMGKTKALNAANMALARQKRAEIKLKNKATIDQLNVLFKQAKHLRTLFSAYQHDLSNRQKTFQLTREEYQSGLISETELINVQKESNATEIRMNGAFYQYMMLIAEIDYHLGAIE